MVADLPEGNYTDSTDFINHRKEDGVFGEKDDNFPTEAYR